ncbi:MAG: hypothetical protein HDR47_06905 [Bacteroides sp.]|nr:hypothetical protein [Bacteroides sp.]
MEHLWLYCQQQLNENLDIPSFVEWKKFADTCYQQKKPEELKIAFFCGNEPENDVRHLLKLGVRLENISAFECDRKLFQEAVDSLHDTFPLLKIYRGKIEDYAELHNTKFDIVYLDFTGSLIKEYKTVAKILDLNALSDMSILAVNTSFPDKTDKNIDVLTNFFYNDTFFEMAVIEGKNVDREDGDTWFYRTEGCDVEGIEEDKLREIIDKNFEHAYSAFQTAFLLDYANRHKASYEVFKQRMLGSRIIQGGILNNFKDFSDNYYDVLLQETIEDGRRLASNQYMPDDFIEKRENGAIFSRLESMKIAEAYMESPYRHSKWVYSKDEETEEKVINVDFKSLLTKEICDVIDKINDWFHGMYRFCDSPMEHLWLELLLNQFGHPYHTNVDNHKRYSYTAKTRKMCIDILTLDKCRALYDWIPMLEYFIHDMQDHNRQMITRMCMDAIDKQLLHIVEECYFGAALVGMNEYEWSKNKVLPNRINLE